MGGWTTTCEVAIGVAFPLAPIGASGNATENKEQAVYPKSSQRTFRTGLIVQKVVRAMRPPEKTTLHTHGSADHVLHTFA